MPRTRPPHRSAAIAALALAAISLAAPPDACATVVEAVYLPSGVVVRYRVKFMPDFDQRRSAAPGTPGLPGDGAMYCVPTSAMNLTAYAANHGFPTASPGPGNWQSNALYDLATNEIATLGALMQTSPTGGTGPSTATPGFDAWLTSAPPLTWQTKWLSPGYAPTVENLGALACSGWMIQFMYGRYEVIDEGAPLPILQRGGGHAVTLTRIVKDAATRQIGYRDPADDPADAVQATFRDRVVTYENMLVVITPNQGSPFLRTVSVLDLSATDGRYRIIDELRAIRPRFGLTFVPAPPGAPGTLKKLDPTPFPGSIDLSPPQLAIPAGTTLLGIDLHSNLLSALVVTDTPGVGSSLQSVDLLTGALSPLGDGAALAPKSMAVGRLGDIYLSDGGKLYRLDADGVLIAASSSGPPISAIAYDDLNDVVVVLSVPQRRLVRFSRDLSTILNDIAIPQVYPMSGPGAVSVDPQTGRMWFVTQGSTLAVGALFNPMTGAVNYDSTATGGVPTAISADRGQRLRLVCDGSVRDVVKINGVWTIDVDSPFHGLASGPLLWMHRGRTDFDPVLHSGPGFENIDPDDLLALGVAVPDCDPDFNLDGVVDGADLGLLLAAWGPAPLASPYDLDRDGTVDGADLGIMLGAWGNCPQS